MFNYKTLWIIVICGNLCDYNCTWWYEYERNEINNYYHLIDKAYNSNKKQLCSAKIRLFLVLRDLTDWRKFYWYNIHIFTLTVGELWNAIQPSREWKDLPASVWRPEFEVWQGWTGPQVLRCGRQDRAFSATHTLWPSE